VVHGITFIIMLVESLSMGYKWPSYFGFFTIMSWLAMCKSFGALSGITVKDEKGDDIRPYKARSGITFLVVLVYVPCSLFNHYFVTDQPILISEKFGTPKLEPVGLLMMWVYLMPFCLVCLACCFDHFQ